MAKEMPKRLEGSEIKSWLAAAPWASQTRNGLLAYFSLTFNIAKELKLLNANPLLGHQTLRHVQGLKEKFSQVFVGATIDRTIECRGLGLETLS